MIREHKDFSPPSDFDPPLWRYMTVERVSDVLTTSELYFARADLLGDPFEGSFPAGQTEFRERFFKDATEHYLKEGLPRDAQLIRQLAYVSCWHMSDQESEHMWHRYGGRAVAVTSSLSRIRCAILELEAAFLLGEVAYHDYSSGAIWEGNVFNPLFAKRREFRDDREFRIVLERLERIGELSVGKYDPPVGVRIPLDLKALVDAIVLHPNLAPADRSEVAGLAEAVGLGSRVADSELSRKPNF
jgi:hypothetical protein